MKRLMMQTENRTRKVKNTLPKYSLGEELVNSISHGVGACLAISGLVLCLVYSKSAGATVGSALFGSFMILLYTLSCLYHALSPKLRGKKVLRIIDHDNVFLMEAGTYMPICLGLLASSGYTAISWVTFGIVWLITIVAVVFTSIDVNKYTWVGLATNLILGWGSRLLLPVFTQVLPFEAIMLFILGGISYTVGAIWYAIGSKVKWMHSIFHFYVLLGSVFHFFFILLFC